MFLRFMILVCLLFFSFWVPDAYKRVTHGFRIAKCQLTWPETAAWKIDPLSPKKKEEIQSVLKQRFKYLGKGVQSYVFSSQDDRYVLKLFRFPSNKISWGRKMKANWKKWYEGRDSERLPFEKNVVRTFGSYKLAYEKAADLMGLTYIHLNPKQTNLPLITIQDRIGVSHQIDPSKYRFILQKKAVRLVPALLKAKEEGSIETLIDSYLTLIKKLTQLGLANQDLNMSHNFAFLDNQAIVIDAGCFFYSPEEAKQREQNFIDRMETCLKKYIPEAVVLVDKARDSKITSSPSNAL